MPESAEPAERRLPEYVRVQHAWYRRNLTYARLASTVTDVLALSAGAAIAVSTGLHVASWVVSVLGAGIAVLTGLRSMFGWTENRRARAQVFVDLDAEIARYLRAASPYDSGDDKRAGDLLQEAVIALVKAETDAWASRDRARAAAGGVVDTSVR